MPLPTPPPPPTPAEFKAMLLHCARHLAPGGGFYGGPLAVTIEQLDGRDCVTVKATRAVSGLEPPPQFRTGRTLFGAESDLVRHFLSDKERCILRELASRAPCRAADIRDAVRDKDITRTTFCELWGNLQMRKLVEELDDGRFAVANEWVRSVVGEAA